jgi:hypothetical protein
METSGTILPCIGFISHVQRFKIFNHFNKILQYVFDRVSLEILAIEPRLLNSYIVIEQSGVLLFRTGSKFGIVCDCQIRCNIGFDTVSNVARSEYLEIGKPVHKI